MADESGFRAILENIGWFRSDTTFLSLNLTDKQSRLFQRAVTAGGGDTPEEALCEILLRGLLAKAEKVAA